MTAVGGWPGAGQRWAEPLAPVTARAGPAKRAAQLALGLADDGEQMTVTGTAGGCDDDGDLLGTQRVDERVEACASSCLLLRRDPVEVQVHREDGRPDDDGVGQALRGRLVEGAAAGEAVVRAEQQRWRGGLGNGACKAQPQVGGQVRLERCLAGRRH